MPGILALAGLDQNGKMFDKGTHTFLRILHMAHFLYLGGETWCGVFLVCLTCMFCHYLGSRNLLFMASCPLLKLCGNSN